MRYNIVGGGLAGCVLASLLPNTTIYEREEIGGLCRDNKHYQELVHILHTDNKKVWDFVNQRTTVRPHTTVLKSYVNGELKPWPAPLITDQVVKEQMDGYNKKMWHEEVPREALERVVTADDGLIFHEKYQGVPDFTKLFDNLTANCEVVYRDIIDGRLDGKVILTGEIDRFFNYVYGKLPYRGMKSVHYLSEFGLDADFVTFSDEKIPFQRIVDYKRLGYDEQWLGIEYACDADHYPMRNSESTSMYNKYRRLAESKGIILVGRLGTYHYMDMDEVIEQCMEVAESLK